MKRFILSVAAAMAMFTSAAAFAADEYNTVPAGDAQYKACKAYALKKYEGGEEKSPIAGQTKAEAWCTCMWNETPDNFKGSLAKFSETAAGAKTNAICEKYSNWGG